MATPTLTLGGGNWATKEDKILAYKTTPGGKFAPIEIGFTRASIGTYIDANGVIQTAASGFPRIDYSDDANGVLLLEPARTNLITNSQNMIGGSWTPSNVTITTGKTGPDSSTWAAEIEATAAGSATMQQSFTGTGDTVFSFFVQAGTTNWIRLGRDAAEATYFDLNNGVVGTMGAANAGIESVGNFYRCWIQFDYTGATNCRLYVAAGDNDSTCVGGENVTVFGAMVEAGSYPTSYIATWGSTVTRVADNFGASEQLSNYFAGGNGSYFTEFAERPFLNETSNSQGLMGARYNSGSNPYVRLRGQSSSLLFQAINISSEVNGNLNTGSDQLKYAFSFDGVNVKCFQQGNKRFDWLLTGTFEPNNGFGYNSAGLTNTFGKIKKIELYNVALSDSELITLTT